MFTSLFWKLTAERAIKTFAQTLASALAVGGVTLVTVNWSSALVIAGTAAAVSVLTSLGSSRIGTPDSPSVVRDGRPQPAPAVVVEPSVVVPIEPVPPTQPEPVAA